MFVCLLCLASFIHSFFFVATPLNLIGWHLTARLVIQSSRFDKQPPSFSGQHRMRLSTPLSNWIVARVCLLYQHGYQPWRSQISQRKSRHHHPHFFRLLLLILSNFCATRGWKLLNFWSSYAASLIQFNRTCSFLLNCVQLCVQLRKNPTRRHHELVYWTLEAIIIYVYFSDIFVRANT